MLKTYVKTSNLLTNLKKCDIISLYCIFIRDLFVLKKAKIKILYAKKGDVALLEYLRSPGSEYATIETFLQLFGGCNEYISYFIQ